MTLLTMVVALAFAPSALADGLRHTERALSIAEPDAPLPLHLNEDLDLREAISFADFLPQGRLSQKTPFIDFSKFELGAFIGGVFYSSEFEADPSYVLGVTARVPLPGIPLGDWGIWAQLSLSYVSRDLPFYYPDQSGNWYGLAAGADYTFVRDEIWFLRAQLGVLYAHWNDIQALDNGLGVLAGVQFGFYWIKGYNKAVVTITPQLSFDGDAYVHFLQVGFSIDF